MEIAQVIQVNQNRPQRSNSNIVNCFQKEQFITNVYQLKPNNFPKFYQYSVKFDPEIEKDSTKLKMVTFSQVKKYVIDDFQTKIFSGDNIYSFIEVQEEKTYKAQAYNVTIKLLESFQLDQLPEGTNNIYSNMLNVKVNNILRELGYEQIGRNGNFFLKQQLNDLVFNQYELKVLQGLKTSVYFNLNNCYLLVDFASRVMGTKSVLEEFKSKKYQSDQDAIYQITGRNCMANYGSQRCYKIEEFDFSKTPKDTFQYKDGGQISYADYMYKIYGAKVQDMQQFMIRSIVKQKVYNKETGKLEKITNDVYLIPELLVLTGMSENQKKDFNCMKQLSAGTKLNPPDRVKFISQSMNPVMPELQKSNNQEIQNKDKNMYLKECDGYVAKPPGITFSHDRTINPGTGQFRIDSAIFDAIFLRKNDWVIIYNKKNDFCDQLADQFLAKLVDSSRRFGITFTPPEMVAMPYVQEKKWVENVEGYIDSLEKQNRPKIIITLIENNQSGLLYKLLKELLLKKKGILHQNVLKGSINKSLSVFGNISLQINSKLNQPLWQVENPQQVGNDVMLIGISHYKKLMTKDKKRCVSIVSTINQGFNKLFAQVSFLKPETEFIKDIKKKVTECILQYYENNQQKYPQKIVLYRYGLGEGQIDMITENEVTQIKKAVSEFNEIIEQISKDSNTEHIKYDPEIAYIVINANPFQKFFFKGFQQSGRGGRGAHGQKFDIHNPQPGTTVADIITSSKFEFYQVSQNVNQGTAKPVRYQVAYNEIKSWNEDTFWLLTYYQCYNYFNWQGAVRVPGIFKCAEKLAFLIGDTYQGKFSSKLEKSQFYL